VELAGKHHVRAALRPLALDAPERNVRNGHLATGSGIERLQLLLRLLRDTRAPPLYLSKELVTETLDVLERDLADECGHRVTCTRRSRFYQKRSEILSKTRYDL